MYYVYQAGSQWLYVAPWVHAQPFMQTQPAASSLGRSQSASQLYIVRWWERVAGWFVVGWLAGWLAAGWLSGWIWLPLAA